jgi:hypothetical protein
MKKSTSPKPAAAPAVNGAPAPAEFAPDSAASLREFRLTLTVNDRQVTFTLRRLTEQEELRVQWALSMALPPQRKQTVQLEGKPVEVFAPDLTDPAYGRDKLRWESYADNLAAFLGCPALQGGHAPLDLAGELDEHVLKSVARHVGGKLDRDTVRLLSEAVTATRLTAAELARSF